MSPKRTSMTAALLATLLMCVPLCASAKPTVVVALAQALVTRAADGTVQLAPVGDGTPIAKGAVIRYTISAKDAGTDAARRLALTGRIPAGTVFVAGSLRGPGGEAQFSLDGKSFSARPMVAKSTPNGTVMVPADPDAYVMVRWVKDAALAAATTTAFSYDVRVQ